MNGSYEAEADGTLISLSCEDFAGALAAKRSVPGGGGAAALVGALSAALCSMVGEFTVGKKRYAGVEDDVCRMLAEAESVRQQLLELVDKDAAAFGPLSRAWGIPKEDSRRSKVIEAATKDAIAAPVEMMRQICRAVELLEEMDEKGSRMLRSDVGCGAALAKAALEAASLNVFVNTASLADRAFAEKTEAACDAMLSEYGPRAEALVDRVAAAVRGKE